MRISKNMALDIISKFNELKFYVNGSQEFFKSFDEILFDDSLDDSDKISCLLTIYLHFRAEVLEHVSN